MPPQLLTNDVATLVQLPHLVESTKMH